MKIDEHGNLIINRKTDKIELQNKGINVSSENGVKTIIPYENTVIENKGKRISLKQQEEENKKQLE